MLEFSFKYKDYEIRACPQHLVWTRPDEKNVTVDLIKWAKDSDGKRYCYSLGYFRKNHDGYHFVFVGDRPFKYIDPEDLGRIWSVLKNAQEILNKFFAEEGSDHA